MSFVDQVAHAVLARIDGTNTRLDRLLALVGRPQRYTEGGQGHSDPPVILRDAAVRQIFQRREMNVDIATGCDGFAMMHIFVRPVDTDADGNALVVPINANSMVSLNVTWQSGLAGGEVQIEPTHGMTLALGANTSIVVRGSLVSATTDPLIVGLHRSVEVVVKWPGTINPESARQSVPMVLLAPEVFSPFLPVPLQAKNLRACLLSTVAAHASLVAEFSTTNNVAGVLYRTADPVDEPIAYGVEFVRFRSDLATLCGPVFDLWA